MDEITCGAVELGGTKTVCAVVGPNGGIRDSVRIPTSDPDTTLGRCIDWFSGLGIGGLGIASFGPVCLDREDHRYGRILNTPKPGWSGTDVLGTLSGGLDVPACIDTDVGCACLGEYFSESNGGCGTMVYITVGTGIGGGIVSDGRILHGRMHPEMGHVTVTRMRGDGMRGVCPYHPDCAESLASGPALGVRAGTDPSLLPESDPVWDTESYYVAQLVLDCIYAHSPDRVVLGGGVMSNRFLIDRIRRDVLSLDGGFVLSGPEDAERTVVPESLDGKQALLGCFRLVQSYLDVFD